MSDDDHLGKESEIEKRPLGPHDRVFKDLMRAMLADEPAKEAIMLECRLGQHGADAHQKAEVILALVKSHRRTD